MKRALAIGVILALIVVLTITVLVLSGAINARDERMTPDRILVMGTGPDSEGVEVVAFAFVVERGSRHPDLLDVSKPSTVSDTSATTARDALPFVGERGMAEVFKSQTGGQTLEWVSIPAASWAEMVDSRGGIVMNVPRDTSVYRQGLLVMLESGTQRLSGEELIALVAASDLFYEEQRTDVLGDLSEGMFQVVWEERTELTDLVKRGEAETSLTPQQMSAFAKGQ